MKRIATVLILVLAGITFVGAEAFAGEKRMRSWNGGWYDDGYGNRLRRQPVWQTPPSHRGEHYRGCGHGFLDGHQNYYVPGSFAEDASEYWLESRDFRCYEYRVEDVWRTAVDGTPYVSSVRRREVKVPCQCYINPGSTALCVTTAAVRDWHPEYQVEYQRCVGTEVRTQTDWGLDRRGNRYPRGYHRDRIDIPCQMAR